MLLLDSESLFATFGWVCYFPNELNNANLRRNSYGALSDFLRLVSYSLGG